MTVEQRLPRRSGVNRGGQLAIGIVCMALIARSYGLADDVLVFGATALTVVLIVDSAMNGLARPVFGWISDTIGRENTMALAFGLGALANLFEEATGGWHTVFVAAALINLGVVLLALFVLKPLRASVAARLRRSASQL